MKEKKIAKEEKIAKEIEIAKKIEIAKEIEIIIAIEKEIVMDIEIEIETERGVVIGAQKETGIIGDQIEEIEAILAIIRRETRRTVERIVTIEVPEETIVRESTNSILLLWNTN